MSLNENNKNLNVYFHWISQVTKIFVGNNIFAAMIKQKIETVSHSRYYGEFIYIFII